MSLCFKNIRLEEEEELGFFLKLLLFKEMVKVELSLLVKTKTVFVGFIILSPLHEKIVAFSSLSFSVRWINTFSVHSI